MRRRTWMLAAALCAVQALWGPGVLTWARWGFFPVDARPIGTPLAAAGVSLSREKNALTVLVRAQALYLERTGQYTPMRATLRRYAVAASLRTAQGAQVALPCRWRRVATGERRCETTLPADLPDGAHTLDLQVSPPGMAPITVSAELPVLTPARTHLLTDRPQYAPGEVASARALTFSRRDLTPLPDRAGTWTLRGADGELLRFEGVSDAWGVATAEVPLPGTPGDAVLSWCSGDACDEQELTIADIALPWLSIDAESTASWVGPGQPVIITGQVTTADGRVAAGATLTASLSILGDWPLPQDWTVRPLTADDEGRFTLALPDVPADLTAPVTLRVGLLAEDGSGGSDTTTLAVPLSPDPIRVSAVTELGGGLAAGSSNRVYLRLTQPDGVPLANQTATITSRWDSLAPSHPATTDADGVLAIQLDPGPSVAIVRPPPPVRAAASASISLHGGTELLSGVGLSLTDRAAFSALTPELTARCVGLIPTAQTVAIGLDVQGGRVVTASPISGDQPTDPRTCLAGILQGRPWPDDGLWRLDVALTPDRSRPTLTATLESADTLPDGLADAARDAIRLASACVAEAARSEPAHAVLSWRLPEGARRPIFSRDTDPCLRPALDAIRLAEPAEVSAQGVLRLGVVVPEPVTAADSPTVVQGWELVVSVGDQQGRWLALPAATPSLRLRPTTPLVGVGEVVEITAIRGRAFSGSLPAVLTMTGPEWSQTCGAEGGDASCPPQVEGRWRFSPPDDGVYWTAFGDAKAAVLVRPASTAGLTLSADARRVAPGAPLTLTARTDGPALVSLVGHDARLAGLMRLPQPTDLLAASLGASGGVFGRYEAVDLVTGALSDAAALAVLSQLSATQGSGRRVERYATSGLAQPEPEAELARGIAEVALVARRRLNALPHTPVTYDDFAAIWDETVAARSATDPWGLPLTLARIAPTEHIHNIDPRDLIRNAAAMPEDLERWSQWARRRSL